MNEQSCIIEDLTIYPYGINLKRKPNAKMNLLDNSNTICINEEENRNNDVIGTNFGH